MRVLALLLSTCLFLPAQEVGDVNKDKAGRTCRIIFPERPNDSPKVAYFFDGKTSQRVSLPSMNFSEVIRIRSGDLTLVLSADEITDPELMPTDAPRIRIPKALSDFYVLITADRSNPVLPVKMNLVGLNGGKLKPGQTLWFNLTDHRIVANLGEAKLSVKPRGKSVSEKPLPKSGHYRAEIGYQANGKGDMLSMTEQFWWHDVRCRHVGFIVNTGGRLPKVYYFRDFRL